MSENPVFAQIRSDLAENDVVLYMKGTQVFPQCGFSAVVVNVLSNLGVKFKSINILEDDDIRQAIKEYANWPTIPQLYVKGEFVGGCDIVKEMFTSGELQDLLKEKGISIQEAA
jgi:monothiol glutaredoxin